MTRAIIFDLDGTLLNVFDYIAGAFEFALRQHHRTVPPREVIMSHVGPPLRNCYMNLTGSVDVDDLILSHKQFQRDNLKLVHVFPGVTHTLSVLKERSIHIGILTSRARMTVMQTLSHTGIDVYVDAVLALEDVVHPKPDPEGILKLLTQFNVDSKDAMMVGDTNVDVEAGKSAGVKTVGVTYGFQGDRIKKARPDAAINTLSELLNL